VSNFEVAGVNSSIDIAVSRRARSTESKSDWPCRICGAVNEAEARTCDACDQDAALPFSDPPDPDAWAYGIMDAVDEIPY
jgi:hypothetical protein